MNLLDFLVPVEELVRRDGPEGCVVISSRVRLARNLEGMPFPGRAKKSDRAKALERIQEAVAQLPQMEGGLIRQMDSFSSWEKQALVERHLISREHAANGEGSGLALSRDQSVGVMINEEDHIRMHALLPGFQLEAAWRAIDELDTLLEERLDYAFSAKLGYLTACPTNVGTGIRVSAMLHLPGLVFAEQINQVIQAVNKLGLAVRGLYGEGTEALGNIFQVSNQMTLGESEEEILAKLRKVTAQLVEHEQNAREALLEKKPRMVFNTVGRAFGTLANAFTISSKEAINLLSVWRLGVELGMFPGVPRALADELLLLCQPAHLQLIRPREMKPEERDILRADLLRSRLAAVARPSLPPNHSDALDK